MTAPKDGKGPRRPRAPHLTPEEFPALLDFFRGYLHEDFPEEYGSPAAALQSFRVDADEDAVRELAAEWERFWKVAKALPFSRLRRLLADDLGSSWEPADAAELPALFARLHDK